MGLTRLFQNGNAEEETNKENLLSYITHQDVRSYGLIPELLGRLPVLVHLEELDKTALTNILTKPKNALLKQYKKLFALENIAFDMDASAIDFIVDKALEYKLPSQPNIKEFVVTADYAREKLSKSRIAKLRVAS